MRHVEAVAVAVVVVVVVVAVAVHLDFLVLLVSFVLWSVLALLCSVAMIFL